MSGRLLLVFGAASLAAVAVGSVVCGLSDIATSVWARNLIGWAVGAAAAFALAATYRPFVLSVVLFAAPLGLAASFLGPDQLGVHRWLQLGPLSMNMAMLLLPAAVVALGVLARGQTWPWMPAFAALALLVTQPDASQATALAAAIMVIGWGAARRPLMRLAPMAAAAALAGLAWFRPDPLQPVPEVEGILWLAMNLSPPLAGLALIAMLAASAAPIVGARAEARLPALALTACLFAWMATPFLGAFPAPLVGVGLSPIVGAWLGVGLLAGVLRRLKEVSCSAGPAADGVDRGLRVGGT